MSSLLPEDVAAHFAVLPHGKAHSVCGQSRRMRFSVRSNARRDRRMRFSVRARTQNALFRRMRFSSPGQTSSRLTEKRTLAQPPYGKPHSAAGALRKTAFCPAASPKTALCARCAALASLITKGVVLKAPVLVDAIAVDLVLGYAYAARVEDRDARVRMPIGVRLEHPLVRVSVHKGCPRR